MPTYDYYCKHCDSDMEIFHSMSAPAVTVCPTCKKRGLTRRIGTGAGLIFKGSGFYETDYKRSAGAGKEDKGSSADKPAAAPDKKSGDSPKKEKSPKAATSAS
jgi:putative FmdB family regulatory protein